MTIEWTEQDAREWITGECEYVDARAVVTLLLAEMDRLRTENAKLLRLTPIARAARRYSTATRDPGGEPDDVRAARHRECNQAWRDLNDALADARIWREIDEIDERSTA